LYGKSAVAIEIIFNVGCMRINSFIEIILKDTDFRVNFGAGTRLLVIRKRKVNYYTELREVSLYHVIIGM
jgi:hypothetical protein